MKKSELVNSCNQLINKIRDPRVEIYGAGEFLEGTVEELIPYLSKEGLIFLRDELDRLLAKD
ncbi:hypothetical protein [Paenibacillus sp. XY044]|uniref:hypothetical protein n=1 Tax=Paenibacillus sp. XY044 TaxID=2026089 RepID=UPI000B99009E|nr:hypothetical protein [Paenibacillus sp. XY044]OZB98126.1 hypothetical protein CJP46_02860 [Paenibacillus sp. XY044]